MLSSNQNKIAIIIADHLRTIIFILKDGVSFGPKGRNYILRKLLKKVCLLSFFNNLEPKKIKKISEKIIEINSPYYSELIEKQNDIIKKISEESEKQFSLLNQVNKKLEKEMKNDIDVEKLFFLYDTQGVPEEMLQHFLKKQGKKFPKKEFSKLLKKQKEKSQQDRKKKKILVF